MNSSFSNPQYRPDIDGLRAIAVLAVVIFHAFPSLLGGGFTGVDVFFVISGFLISTIIFKKIDNGSFSFSNFYSRRILRIFPSLTVVLIFVLFFGWICLLPEELQQLGKHITSSAGFIQNFTLWKEDAYFDNIGETKPLLHIWSLGIEEQFYIIWPLILWFTSKIIPFSKSINQRKVGFLLITTLVFISSFILNLKLIKSDPTQTFYLPQYRFFEMALGAIVAWWFLYQKKSPLFILPIQIFSNTSDILKKITHNICSFLGFLILLGVFIQFNQDTEFPGVNSLFPIFATVLIIAAGPQAWFNKNILSNKALVWFGLISFPLYLWHWPILSFGQIIYGETPSVEFRIIAIIISIFLAWLTFKFIETPFRYGKVNIKLKITTLCTMIIALAVLGYWIQKNIISLYSSDSEKEIIQYILDAEENCKKEFPSFSSIQSTSPWNTCRLPKKDNDVALIGDSYSSQLYFGMANTLYKTTHSVAGFSFSCAFPAKNIATRTTNLTDPNYLNYWKYTNEYLEYISKSKSIQTIYIVHNPDCSFGEGQAIDLENPSETNTAIILKTALKRTLDLFKDRNIIIVLPNPKIPFSTSTCISKNRFLKDSEVSCFFKLSSTPARDQYKKIVTEVTNKYSMVEVMDLTESFCNSGSCSAAKDNQLLYSPNDSEHLNFFGSTFVSEYLLEAIHETPTEKSNNNPENDSNLSN